MTYEPGKSPEEFGDEVATALWAVLTPEEAQMIRETLELQGREGVRRHVDRNLRDDMARREEYVEAATDAFTKEMRNE